MKVRDFEKVIIHFGLYQLQN